VVLIRELTETIQPRPSLHSAIASQIGSMIVKGRLSEGSTLPNEMSLGAQFGVSRTALREAIKVLASKGLVEVRRKTGTRVNGHAQWNVLDPEILAWMFSGKDLPVGLPDLMEVRMLIEPAGAAMAANRATSEDVHRIRQGLLGMESTARVLPASVESDLRFHMAILGATHNAFMRPFGALIQVALGGSFRLTSSNPDLYRSTIPLHRKVFEAIETRKATKARAAMTALLTQTQCDIDDQLRKLSARKKKR